MFLCSRNKKNMNVGKQSFICGNRKTSIFNVRLGSLVSGDQNRYLKPKHVFFLSCLNLSGAASQQHCLLRCNIKKHKVLTSVVFADKHTLPTFILAVGLLWSSLRLSHRTTGKDSLITGINVGTMQFCKPQIMCYSKFYHQRDGWKTSGRLPKKKLLLSGETGSEWNLLIWRIAHKDHLMNDTLTRSRNVDMIQMTQNHSV